jgi:hypothetical protein
MPQIMGNTGNKQVDALARADRGTLATRRVILQTLQNSFVV